MGSPTLTALLLSTAFLLSFLPASPRTHLPLAHLQVLTNFECKTRVLGALPKIQCQWKLREDPTLPVPTLTLSTVQLCQHECQTCVRVCLALNATGIKGLEIHFLVQSSNRSGQLRVLKRRKTWIATETLWQMQFDCFPAEGGQQVLVSVETIPNRNLNLSQRLRVANNHPEPEFNHRWLPAARAVEVSVLEGPVLVRLCHQLALVCEELYQPFHQQALVSRNHTAVLRYELLLPCLCIEASHKHQDSLRKKVCPFRDQQEAYGPDLWSSIQFQDHSSSDKAEMVMILRGRCPLHPTVSLCWKVTPEATCEGIPNSTVVGSDEVKAEYIVEEVDVHPQLCFKFSFTNSSHVECPHRTVPTWNVSISVRFLQLHVHFHSRIPASFSSALCQPLSPSQCEPEPPVYTVTHPEGSGPRDLDLILPWRALRSCVLVWRSDVRFAGKHLLCPDVSHKHWGLLALVLGLVLGLLVAVILLVRWGLCKFQRDTHSKHRSRPILLVYSSDSEEHKQLVCAFAALLRSALGCPVLLDLWELKLVGRLGILPWMYAQREQVSQEQGQVLLLWSRGSTQAYGLWRGKASESAGPVPEPHDLFGAAMACLQSEQWGMAGARRQSNWVIAYFSKLCGRRDIPRALRFLPHYRLPQELPGLVKVLQGPSSSAPSWLRARAKRLVCHLRKAERKKSLQSRLYQPWKTNADRPAGSLVPLAHPKLRRPNCT